MDGLCCSESQMEQDFKTYERVKCVDEFCIFMNFVDNFKCQHSSKQAASLLISPSEAFRQSVSSCKLAYKAPKHEQLQ